MSPHGGPSRVGRVRRGPVIATLVVLAVLVIALLVTDGVVRSRTEDAIAADLQQQIPGLESAPEVTVEGWPFLTQVLAGELDDVRVTAPSATVDGLRLDAVDVRLRGVTTDRPYTAREATMTASAPVGSLQDQLPFEAQLETVDGVLTARGSVLGLDVEADVVPLAAGRTVEISIKQLRIGGATVSADDLPFGLGDQLDLLALPVPGLPEGMELTEVVVDGDTLDLAAAGTDVVLEAPQG